MGTPGKLYLTNKNQYGIAYDYEQLKAFERMGKGKILVHLFEDLECTRPVKEKDGTDKKVLKEIDTLKLIGYVD